MDTNSQHVQDIRIMFKDMVSLLEAAEVFKKANYEGEKWEKNNPESPVEEKDAQHPDQTKGEQDSGATTIAITTSSIFSPTPPRELTSPRDEFKGKESHGSAQGDEKTQKMAELEAKRQKMLVEYNHQISFRADQLPITKIIYVVNPNKEGTMKITTGDTPLNLIIHPNFRLKTMGFSEWLEVHALASKKSRKSNDMLLQSLRAKF
ncbi:hypothetical protein Tco_0866380 [Tanacetum coccineum]